MKKKIIVLGSGLVGGPGIVSGANVGTKGHAVFESVCIHNLFISF